MHNIKDVRKNLNFYKKKISERNTFINFDELIKLDEDNRQIIQKKEKKRTRKKTII